MDLHPGYLALFATLLAALVLVAILAFGQDPAKSGQPLMRFEYSGHRYLERNYVGSENKPFIHDPDCPCHDTLNP